MGPEKLYAIVVKGDPDFNWLDGCVPNTAATKTTLSIFLSQAVISFPPSFMEWRLPYKRTNLRILATYPCLVRRL